ncbi:MAG: hypothetical protein RIT43_2449 [Bacteroidota bacterium]|jgi:antitoxin component YwqK of YwqJK toxin-antitoxin module
MNLKHLTLLVSLLLFASCEEEPEKKVKKSKPETLVEVKNGIFYEWYPGKKQIKYKGGQDEEKKRNGVWTFYAEDGTELSVTYYEHGLKQGFSIVKYPTGVIHYKGEYHKDQMVGEWTTYNERGEVETVKDFGAPKQ